MMVFKKLIRVAIKALKRLEDWSSEKQEKIYIEAMPGPEKHEEIHSVWDYLKFKENTQAFHLSSVLGFEEWVDMQEIRRRIKGVFGAEYKNERSLYPYLKTLDDIGLIESTNVGGKRQWRKKDILIKKKDEGAVSQGEAQKAKAVKGIRVERKG